MIMGDDDRISARYIGDGAWEVSLPRRASAVRGTSAVRPRHVVRAAGEEEAIRIGRGLFEREYVAYAMGSTMRLSDLALFWIAHAEADGTYSAETAADYRNLVSRYVVPHFARDADVAAAVDFERFYSFLLARGGRRGDGVSPATVRKLNTVLRAAYGFLVREGVADSNPMLSVRLPSRTVPDRRSLTEREFALLIDGLEAEIGIDPGDDAGVLRRNALFGAYLDLRVGARVGEICALTRADVSFSAMTVAVEHSMSERGGLHRKRPKTASGRRTIALDPEAFDRLVDHLGWQDSVFGGSGRMGDSAPVCCTADGGFIRPSVMSAVFKAFCAEIGIELADGESFHIMRHTHATQLLAGRVNPEAVKARLGHSRIETTYAYGHVMPGEDAAATRDYGEIARRARAGGSTVPDIGRRDTT